MKNDIIKHIEDNKKELHNLSNYIFENPEFAFQEFKAQEALCDFLAMEGFSIEKGVGSIDTSFKAVYENGDYKYSIGLLCEYDAIENVGHACAHHMQGPAIVGAAKAIKDLLGHIPYKLVVYGTPAEEGGGGKITMLKNGCFNDIDVALMMHGGPETTTDVKSLASSVFKVVYKGKKAHAALKPEDGRSALDAMLLTFNAIEFLREHVPEDTRMHYTIKETLGPANVVHDRAVGEFSLRSYSRDRLDNVVDRFKKIVEGACLMTETDYELELTRAYNNKIPVIKLNDVLIKNAELVNAPNIKPPRLKTGSTDFGDVMYELPGSCIRVAFVKPGTSSHSQEYIDEGLTEKAMNAVTVAAQVLALSCYDLLTVDGLAEEIAKEFKANKLAAQR